MCKYCRNSSVTLSEISEIVAETFDSVLFLVALLCEELVNC